MKSFAWFAAMNPFRSRKSGIGIGAAMRSLYEVECRDRHGRVKWVERVPNLVTTEGLDHLLGVTFKGTTPDTTWFVGLVDGTGFVAFLATDTAAKITLSENEPTTNGWQEFDDYSEAARQALTLGSVSGGSVDNSASKAAFSIDDTGSVHGAFVSGVVTVGGTTTVLYGEAAFAAPRDVESGDTLNVTVTLTAAAA